MIVRVVEPAAPGPEALSERGIDTLRPEAVRP
jgi:hypothetical protein